MIQILFSTSVFRSVVVVVFSLRPHSLHLFALSLCLFLTYSAYVWCISVLFSFHHPVYQFILHLTLNQLIGRYMDGLHWSGPAQASTAPNYYPSRRIFFASKQNVFKSHNYVSTHFGFVGEQTKNNKQKHHSNAISDSHSDKFTSFVCVCVCEINRIHSMHSLYCW